MADQAAELPPRETIAELTSLPNDDLSSVPETKGALQGPPTRTQPEEGGRRDGQVTGVTEEGARATSEAGVASEPQWDMQRASVADPLPLPLRPAAVTKHEAAVANHEAAVAAMQGASVAIPLPLLLLGEPALEAAVAAMKGATPGRPRSMSRLRTGS